MINLVFIFDIRQKNTLKKLMGVHSCMPKHTTTVFHYRVVRSIDTATFLTVQLQQSLLLARS